MRKSKTIKEELLKAQERLNEVERLRVEAENEEKEILSGLNEKLQRISENNNVFIGVVLGKQDLINILTLALETGETIKIPAMIYFND